MIYHRCYVIYMIYPRCYVMLGSWTEITYGYTTEKLPEILGHYREACNRDSKWYKVSSIKYITTVSK